jgi:hypothetical protein
LETPSLETLSSIAVPTPVTANPVKTAMSALPPLDHHDKENTAADKATALVGSAKKRKADDKSTIPKGKRSKVMEDNSMIINTHGAQEKETPGNSVAETTATAVEAQRGKGGQQLSTDQSVRTVY